MCGAYVVHISFGGILGLFATRKGGGVGAKLHILIEGSLAMAGTNGGGGLTLNGILESL